MNRAKSFRLLSGGLAAFRPAIIGLWLAVATLGRVEGAGNLPADHAGRMARGLQTFQKDVRSLLIDQCLRCHGGKKTKGGLVLTTREDLLKGGTDGVVLVPFNARSSRLLQLIRHDEEPHMPDKKPRLPEAAIAKIAAWIDDGAPYDRPLIGDQGPGRDKSVVTDEDKKWWAFQPLAKLEPPPARRHSEVASPIDRFILAKASPKRLKLSPCADLPYDQFVRWQIAGDEFEPDNALALTPTGFLGAGVFPTQITANEVERTRYD